MDRKNNCFNFIRIFAALQVFIGHACEHLEVNMPTSVHELWWAFRGVPIFFVLSGFWFGILWRKIVISKVFV